MDNLDINNYISLKEAVKYLGIKAPTLRSWIKNPRNKFLPIRLEDYRNSNALRIEQEVLSGNRIKAPSKAFTERPLYLHPIRGGS